MTAVTGVPSLEGMLARVLIAAAALFILSRDSAADERESTGWAGDWTTADTVLEAAVLATFAIDYTQTKRIVSDGRESNMLLSGGHISTDAYFLTVAASHVLVTRILPSRWRHVLQGVTIGAQTRSIARNWQAGYTLSF